MKGKRRLTQMLFTTSDKRYLPGVHLRYQRQRLRYNDTSKIIPLDPS